MISLSDNEFTIINFLVRNFSEKLTIRSIAQRLGFSPAGVFKILKKLEKEGIVSGQKLGTGLFYSMNFDNRVSRHLACIVLIYSEKKISVDIGRLKHASSAILSEKNLLLVADSALGVDVSLKDISIITKSEDEIIELLRKKDQEILGFLKNGIVLFGEEKIVSIIKNCSGGF